MKNNDLTDQREFWEQKRLDECEYYAEWEEMEHEEKIKDVNGIIETLKNAPNEATRAPYWMILDPVQNMGCDIHLLACQITGPFFSRDDAESFLQRTRYNFSERARVYCLSGHNSAKYAQLFES